MIGTIHSSKHVSKLDSTDLVFESNYSLYEKVYYGKFHCCIEIFKILRFLVPDPEVDSMDGSFDFGEDGDGSRPTNQLSQVDQNDCDESGKKPGEVEPTAESDAAKAVLAKEASE